ncbi:MAG TPA: two-component system histidine kinase PnpS [Candidatus Hypogeohydataceae bacterium YC41]
MKRLLRKTFLGYVALMGIYVLIVGLFVNTPLSESLGLSLSFALGSLLATAIALPVGWFINRRLLNPLKEVTKAVEGFSRGDFSKRINIYSQDELGLLSMNLNQVAREMEKTLSSTAKDKNQLEALLSSMTEGVVAVDSQEKIFKINYAASQMLHLPMEKAFNRYLWEVLRNPKLTSLIREVLKEGDRRGIELTDLQIPVWSRSFTSGGRTFRIQISPIQESGKVSGAAVVLHDITDLKKLEKTRVEFVANVSHELKTPLASIKGFVETLKDGAVDEPENARRFLGIIEKHSNRLDNLINDLLNLSRIELRETPLELKRIRLLSLIKKITTNLEDRIREKNHVLELLVKPEGLELVADEPLLDQALTNLLDNAIKYTPEGGRLSISAREDGGRIELSVADTGIGIPEQDLPRIFERFYRVDKARSREMGGTGLGLAIVKHIMLAHGGEARVKSQPGLGSTFTLSFPIR